MKRRDLLRHLEEHGCEFLREAATTRFTSTAEPRKSSAIPRHREIIEFIARKICKDLDVPFVK